MTAGIDYVGISTPFYCNDGKGNFVLHKRSSKCRDEQGTWDTGGGQLEFGQTPEENVIREVEEEYGCVGKIQERIPAYSVLRTHQGKKTHWLAIPFFILVRRKKVKINEPDKIDAIGWFTLDKLPKPLHSAFADSLKRHQDFFKKYQPT